MKNKIAIIFCGFLLVGAVYLLTILIYDNSDKVEYINPAAGITKGIVTGIHPDNKRSISVRFHVGSLTIDAIDEITFGNELHVGDSIVIKYSVGKPDLIVTEYNTDF
jgi:hypothetical protein